MSKTVFLLELHNEKISISKHLFTRVSLIEDRLKQV